MMLFWMTRPREQAALLSEALRMANVQVIQSALTQIKPFCDSSIDFDPKAAADITIYTSVNAVNHCATLHAPALAIGLSTADALQQKGIELLALPEPPYYSEQLLFNPSLQAEVVQGKTIRLVKGVGGRALLRKQLLKRGAVVQSYDVYRQYARPVDGNVLSQFIIHAGETWVLAMSRFILDVFQIHQNSDLQRLKQSANLLCISPRVAEYAKELGWQKIKCASSASRTGILSIINP